VVYAFESAESSAPAGLVPNYFSLIGPRVPAGTYTVKMIKNKDVFNTQLQLVPDARSRHTEADRKLQAETALKLYQMLDDLTYKVDTITSARNQARARAAQLSAGDVTRNALDAMATSLDQVRGKIVATREDGGITGEERIREQMGGLYGDVNGYEGRPTQSQIDRINARAKDLDAVIAQFDALVQKDLAAINETLAQKQLEPIKVPSRADWEKAQPRS
jgi:hypothetical protein